MVAIGGLLVDPPVLNSSCPWASTAEQLEELFYCRNIGAVVTRTATLEGFPEAAGLHQHLFFTPEDDPALNKAFPTSSVNTYGYSPRSLGWYLVDVRNLITESETSMKPIIISIAGSIDELPEMIGDIQRFRRELSDGHPSNAPPWPARIGIELNSSCPNIDGKPPPAYNAGSMLEYLRILAAEVRKDPTLTVGVKLAPYTYDGQFVDFIDALLEVSEGKGCPIAYIAATNTLGSSMVFASQAGDASKTKAFTGGVAGDSIHALSLGNVCKLSKMLAGHRELQNVKIIGIGGVRTAEGAARMAQAGAAAVACATALGRLGVGVFSEIREGIDPAANRHSEARPEFYDY